MCASAADLVALDAIITQLVEALSTPTSTPAANDGVSPGASPGGVAPPSTALTDAAARGQGRSFSMKVVSRIAERVQIHISDVHVRVESPVPCTPHSMTSTATAASGTPISVQVSESSCISCGLVLASLSVASVKSDGSLSTMEAPAVDTLSYVHKQCTIDGLGAYVCPTDVTLANSPSLAYFIGCMRARIPSDRAHATVAAEVRTPAATRSTHAFVLEPLMATLQARMNDSGNPSAAELSSLLRFVLYSLRCWRGLRACARVLLATGVRSLAPA
ncbi:hypothetical protein EON66_02500 [archaeon]|nr:MAG: hypothetical protein EON66_02500 [archaeon]